MPPDAPVASMTTVVPSGGDVPVCVGESAHRDRQHGLQPHRVGRRRRADRLPDLARLVMPVLRELAVVETYFISL